MQLMVLDRDPQVVGLSARPVGLIWRHPRQGRRPLRGAGRPDAAAVLAAACAVVGFAYRRLVAPEKAVGRSSWRVLHKAANDL
jgi:hypothetical protein